MKTTAIINRRSFLGMTVAAGLAPFTARASVATTLFSAGDRATSWAALTCAQMQAMVWPATHYVAIARGIFLKGAGLSTFAFDALFLLGMGVVFNGLAVWRLKKKLG